MSQKSGLFKIKKLPNLNGRLFVLLALVFTAIAFPTVSGWAVKDVLLPEIGGLCVAQMDCSTATEKGPLGAKCTRYTTACYSSGSSVLEMYNCTACASGYTTSTATYNSSLCGLQSYTTCVASTPCTQQSNTSIISTTTQSCSVNCGTQACTLACSVACTNPCTTGSCPANATCTWNTGETCSGTKSGTQSGVKYCSQPGSRKVTTRCNGYYTSSGTTNCSGCSSQTTSNGTCSATSGSSQSYGNCTEPLTGSTCTATGSCSGSCTCSRASFTCNAGYYKNSAGTACVKCEAGYYCTGNNSRSTCPSGYGTSAAGSDAATDCYKSCTKACTQQSCPENATCTHGTSSTSGTQYYNGSCSAASSTCSITISCSAGYYLSNGSCKKCESGYYCTGNTRTACPAAYPNSATGSDAESDCYITVARGCTQNDGAVPSGCSSVTAWNACSCAGGTYNKYANGSTSGTTSNETCTKTPKTVTAKANYYVDGTTCPACSSYSSTYTKSDGGSIGSGSCYTNVTRGCTQNDGAAPSGCSSVTAWNACSCAGGTYKKYASGSTSGTTSNETCTKTPKTVTASANYYVDGITCPACPSGYPKSDGGNITSAYCYKNVTLTGQQLDPAMMTGCNTRTLSACTPGTCTYRDYNGATDGSCTPTNCTKGQCCTSVAANYYITTSDNCTATPCSNYPDYPLSDGGNITSAYCYKNVTLTGQQLEPTMMTGCDTRTLSACTPGTCTYKDYRTATDGSCTPTNCTKGQCCTSVSANYYISSTDNCTAKSCSANYADYPYSDGGKIGNGYCYKNVTLTGQQLEPTMMTGCDTRTLSACTPGTCTYKDYRTATDGSCTPTNCTKGQCCTSASANYYISSTDNCTAKSCSANYADYPYSDGGKIGNGYCYKNVTLTGTQTACSTPTNSASYTCGTCSPGTCTYKDYHTATDTPCTPGNCIQPVNPGSVVCNTGYYTDGTTCPACTNAPSNSSYTGTATSNACPWSCNSGYNQTYDDECEQMCGAGITHLHLTGGVRVPLYAVSRTTPAINVKWNNTVCYGSLATGTGSGLNIKTPDGKTYHAVN